MKPEAVIYIIESVGVNDLKVSRCEGRALSEALLLAGHKVFYSAVANISELEAALKNIELSLGPLNRAATIVPFFHISAHGNEDGIELTDGTFVSWEDLGALLWSVGERTGRVQYGTALAHITMSSCMGIHGASMWRPDRAPAVSLIGPSFKVPWSDALTAWIVFYHLVLIKNAIPTQDDTLQAVNNAAGVNDPDGFVIFAAAKKPS